MEKRMLYIKFKPGSMVPITMQPVFLCPIRAIIKSMATTIFRYRSLLIVVVLIVVLVAGGIWSRRSKQPASPAQQTVNSRGAISDNNQPLVTLRPVVEACLPGIGVCPGNRLCPKNGVCCVQDNSDCQPPLDAHPLQAIFCLTPGKPDCPGSQACPATGVCSVLDTSFPVCVPGSSCADGIACSKSGYCVPKEPTYIACFPFEGTCPNGVQCPNTGICPY